MTQSSNSSCGEDVIPTVSSSAVIYTTNAVYDGVTGSLDGVVRGFYPSGTAYSYLWLRSRQFFYQRNGSVFIHQVLIEDKGFAPTPPTVPPPTTGCPARVETDAFSLKLSLPDDKIKKFGSAVAAHGDYLVVGAHVENKVYVYKKTACAMTLNAVLSAGPQSTRFGRSVDIHDDQIIVGGETPSGGEAYIFRLINGTWTQVAFFTGELNYGYSVSIDGNFALVGSPSYSGNQGRAIFYERLSQDNWTYYYQYTGAGTESGFGKSVHLRSNAAIVGAPDASDRIYLYEFIPNLGGFWGFKAGFTHQQEYEYYEKFGFNVRLSDNGLQAFASGAYLPMDDAPNAILGFELAGGNWSHTATVHSTYVTNWTEFAVGQDRLVYASGPNLLLYEKISGSWQHISTVTRDTDYYQQDDFGELGLTDQFAAVGYPEPFCTYSGSVYVYDLFALMYAQGITRCNQIYVTALGTINARMVTLGCNDGNGVVFLSGSSATYNSTIIKLLPGFSARNGSQFSAIATGCNFADASLSARMASNRDEPRIYTEPPPVSSLSEFGDEYFSAFPNPTSTGTLSVQSHHGEIKQVKVYNVEGILIDNVRSTKVDGNSIEITLPQGAYGVYILKVLIDGKSQIKKVVFQ